MTTSLKAAVLSITLLASVPASAIGFPKLTLRNALKGGVVALIGTGAAIYYFKKQKTESELAEKKSLRTQEEDALTQAVEVVSEIVGQEGKDDKLTHVENDGTIVAEKTPATGLGKVVKFIKKQVIPVATVLVTLDKTREEVVKGVKRFGFDLESIIPTVPNLSE